MQNRTVVLSHLPLSGALHWFLIFSMSELSEILFKHKIPGHLSLPYTQDSGSIGESGQMVSEPYSEKILEAKPEG